MKFSKPIEKKGFPQFKVSGYLSHLIRSLSLTGLAPELMNGNSSHLVSSQIHRQDQRHTAVACDKRHRNKIIALDLKCAVVEYHFNKSIKLQSVRWEHTFNVRTGYVN
jgi:hypothetical protein